jgi:hypothetical protein
MGSRRSVEKPVGLQQALSRPSTFRTASSKPGVDFDVVPAAGPPLWDDGGDAQMDDELQIEPDWDLAAQPAPDFEVDQRINW